MPGMQRGYTTQTRTIANGAATSDVVDFQGYAFGSVLLPASMDGATMKFMAVYSRGGTPVDLYDSTGVIVPPAAIGATSRVIDLPAALAGVPFFTMVTNIVQTGLRTLIVSKKA
jgi:hypothetical protein